jgi:uncharacterized protein YndB with AHSA1/START domain
MNKSDAVEKLAPVRKSIQVSLAPEAAFKLFTEGIATWWPLRSHSVGEDRAVSCTLEPKVDGRIYETLDDGSQSDWGRVIAYEPPHMLAFTWHPGRAPETAQQVEVTFSAVDGGTRLQLVHQGWELLGEQAVETRNGYDTGWDYVLGQYIDRADS